MSVIINFISRPGTKYIRVHNEGEAAARHELERSIAVDRELRSAFGSERTDADILAEWDKLSDRMWKDVPKRRKS